MNSVYNVKNEDDFGAKLEEAKKRLVVVHFWAPWAEQCKQMDDVMLELAKQNPNVVFLSLEAEDIPDVSVSFGIEAVPTFIFLKNKQKIGRLDGAHAPELTKLVKQHVDTIAPPTPAVVDEKTKLNNRIKALINSAPCVLFMKGSAAEPRCGFSRQMVALLKEHNCKFSTYDILQDNPIRQGLKEYSNWPTFPQLYVKGELIGGLDIVREMAVENELKDVLPQLEKEDLNDRIKAILNKDSVVLFMKGQPNAPKCGFSRQIIEILNQTGVDFAHFDILTDNEIRQGLKKFSDWPTYPQLYVKGELIGGLDIVKEMSLDELKEALQPTAEMAENVVIS